MGEASGEKGRRPETGSRRWLFAHAVLDERSLTLTVNGEIKALDPKPLEVLLHLLHHAGEVVTKDELLAAVWPGRIISDSALTSCIARLRDGLADEDQSIIKTVHGYGYRLIAPVKVEASTAPPPPRFDFKPGESPQGHPNWKLVERLGTGGHGEVWLARHDKTGEPRIFKYALDPEALPSLKREITLSRYLHDTLGDDAPYVRVLDWNLDVAPFCIQAEYTQGGNLNTWAQAQGGITKVPFAARLDLAVRIAEALAAAHSVGVLHKDLKPSNVLIDSEGGGSPRIRLSDFGSGGVLDPNRLDALGITRMGLTMTQGMSATSGTPIYLAPELIAEQPATMQTDIYAMGVLLYQLVIGDLKRPLAPGWEHDVPDPVLREDILAAAAGNPARRLKDAAELVTRLKNLEQRRAPRPVSVPIPAPRRAPPWRAAVAALGILASLAAAYIGIHRSGGTSFDAPSSYALAVLPFASAADDPESAALSDSLFVEVLRSLGRVPGLALAPRDTVVKFGGKVQDARAAGAALHADHVMTAVADRRDDTWIVNVRMVRPGGGEEWSEAFEAKPGELIRTMDRLLDGVVQHSGITLDAAQRRAAFAHGTDNDEAYALFLRASSKKSGAGPSSLPQESAEASIALLDKAVALDDRFARAYVAIAMTYNGLVYWRTPTDREALKKGFAAAERAIELEPNLPEAHNTRAMLGMTPLNGFDFDLGIKEAQRALAIDPNSAGALGALVMAYTHIGLPAQDDVLRRLIALSPGDRVNQASRGPYLIWGGQAQEGLDVLEKYSPQDMLIPQLWYWTGAWALMDLGRNMQAEARIEEGFKKYGDRGGMLTGRRALLHAVMGDYARAEKDLAAAAANPPFGHFHHTAYEIGATYALMDRHVEALKWLRQSADTGFPNYPVFLRDKNLDKLRNDPEFIKLMETLRARFEHYKVSSEAPPG